MKRTFLASLILCSGIFAVAQKTVTISGTVINDTKGYNKMQVYGNEVQEDSTYIKDGKFSIDIPFSKPFMVFLYAEYTTSQGGMYTPYALLIDRPGTINIANIDLNKGMESGTASGLESAVLYRSFTNKQDSVYRLVSELLFKKTGKYYAEENDPQYTEIETEREKLMKVHAGNLLTGFLNKYPDSYASVIALSSIGRSIYSADEQEALYKKLSKKMQQSEDGIGVMNFIEGTRSSSIGSAVKDFTLPAPDEKPLAFSSFKGKYVLIDFWASWCMPCKESFPHLKEVYQQYKGDKFEVYSISIDKNKAAWLKAVKEEAFPWPQSLDTKDISHKGFAVTGVPSTFLIGPDGKIIAKEVGFNPNGTGDIEKKLKELFGGKPVAAEKKESKAVEAVPSVPSMPSEPAKKVKN